MVPDDACPKCGKFHIPATSPCTRETIDKVLGTDLCACGKCSNCQNRNRMGINSRAIYEALRP
jgi:hypothetical protein